MNQILHIKFSKIFKGKIPGHPPTGALPLRPEEGKGTEGKKKSGRDRNGNGRK